MIKLKQAAALLLSTALLTALLAGCGEKKADPIMDSMGYSKDTVFATIGKDKITAEEYLVWLTNYVDYMNSYYQMMGATELNWDEDLGDGLLVRDYLKTQAMEQAKLFWAMEHTAKQEGVSLDDEDKKVYEDERTAGIEQLGGEAQYYVYMNSMLMTEDMMQRVMGVSSLSEKLEAALCREGGRFEATKDNVRTYMEEQGILKSKHILYATKDSALDGAPYSDAKIAEQKQRADAALAQIRAAADPIATFNQLMTEQSEDLGLAANPDGYLFSTKPDGQDFPSRMVTEFEDGTQALSYNTVGDVIQSEHGYHIILRLDPVEDEKTFETYRDKWYGKQMDTVYQEAVDGAELKTTASYDNLNVEEFYTKLTAYREAQENTLPAEDATPPEGDGTTTPEGDATTPEGGTTTPDAGATTPEDGTTTPDAGATAPEGSTTPPDASAPTPEGDTTAPDAGAATPEGGTTPTGDTATPPQ